MLTFTIVSIVVFCGLYDMMAYKLSGFVPLDRLFASDISGSRITVCDKESAMGSLFSGPPIRIVDLARKSLATLLSERSRDEVSHLRPP